MTLSNVLEFEKYVADIFSISGYTVKTDVPLNDKKNIYLDIVATKNDTLCFVETKFTHATEQAAVRIIKIAESSGATPVLVTAYKLEENQRISYAQKYPNLKLVDIANLLYAVQDDVQLRNKLVSVLPYAIEGIEPKPGFLQSDILMHTNYTEAIIGEMRLCMPGRPMASKYEEIAQKLLENIFSEDLALWKPQQKSNNDLYRFDLLCRIKDGNQKTFWSILERFFNSKYVVFEFKNYSDTVTQKEIYTTEKYLYAKALRRVAIIVSANGYDENARWAAKGCLRENGKLIILLDTDDLIKMNQMKMDNDDPTDYMMDKLDGLLLELEK